MWHNLEIKNKKALLANKTFWIIVIFLLILALLFYQPFLDITNLTGNVINDNQNITGIDISGSLTIPELFLKGDLGEIEFRGNTGFLYVEDQKMPLSNFGFDKIVIRGFQGKIELNKSNILVLKGKATQVFLNGNSVMSERDNIDVYLEPSFKLNYFKTDKKIFIKNLEYTTSGALTLGQQKLILNLDNENIDMDSLVTTVRIETDAFHIDGKVKSLEITGNQEISISA